MIKMNSVMQQNMDRKKFLSLLGLGFLTIIGVPSLMGALSISEKKVITSGYGSSRYDT